jgi:phosphatidylinositol-3,4,5-trisphosphate 3-phosphatase and dual-specificity protein phosphatase PTEN
LCSEREYASSSFDSCARYPFDDHNCPKFAVLLHFCQDVQEFLNRDPQNVVAIHCKAGKGRTGLVISCFLQYCGVARNADEGLKQFAEARTKNSKGVTIPSQIRYVRYFGEFLKRFVMVGRDFPFDHPQKLIFTGMQLTGRADFDVGGGCDPYIRCFLQDGTEIYNMKKDKKNKVKNWKGTPSFRLSFAVPVQGDIHVLVYDQGK